METLDTYGHLWPDSEDSTRDDVTKTVRQNYYAFRRLKNFACVEVHPQSGALLLYLKVDPSSVDLQTGFSRDVSKIGHFGTGDLELTIRSRRAPRQGRTTHSDQLPVELIVLRTR